MSACWPPAGPWGASASPDSMALRWPVRSGGRACAQRWPSSWASAGLRCAAIEPAEGGAPRAPPLDSGNAPGREPARCFLRARWHGRALRRSWPPALPDPGLGRALTKRHGMVPARHRRKTSGAAWPRSPWHVFLRTPGRSLSLPARPLLPLPSPCCPPAASAARAPFGTLSLPLPAPEPSPALSFARSPHWAPPWPPSPASRSLPPCLQHPPSRPPPFSDLSHFLLSRPPPSL